MRDMRGCGVDEEAGGECEGVGVGRNEVLCAVAICDVELSSGGETDEEGALGVRDGDMLSEGAELRERGY